MSQEGVSPIGLIHEYGQLSRNELYNLTVLRTRMRTAPKARYSFWDDKEFQKTCKKELNPDAYDAIKSGKAKFIGGFLTNVNLATVRFLNLCQTIENKYKQHPADFLKSIYTDGHIEFEMDGWHP